MKKAILVIVFLSLTCSASGCIKYQASPLSATDNAAALQGRSLDDPGLKKFLEANLHHELLAWPLQTWDLPTLTLVAFYYHPDLDVARAKWGVLKGGVKTAGARPNPTISSGPEYAFNSDIGVSPWVMGFTFDIPIETAGKRGYRIAQAKHLSDSGHLNIATVAWQVRSRLRNSLVDLYAARQGELIQKKLFTLREKNILLLKTRIAQQGFSPLALYEAEVLRNQTLVDLRGEQKKTSEALAQVATALGLPVAALEEIRLNLDFVTEFPKHLPAADVRQQALLNRPDILSGLADYAATESGLQLEIAKQYPDIHIGPGYLFDQGEHKWITGFSITPPLFDRNRGAIAEAEARRTESAANFNALQAKIIGEIGLSWMGYNAALKKLQAANALFNGQKKRRTILEDITSPGELRRVAQLQIDTDFVSSDMTRLSTLVETQQSLGLLEDAVQRPLDDKEWSLEIPDKNPRIPETDKP